MKLVLCGYHLAGQLVLEHILGRSDISDLAVFTHEPVDRVPDVRLIANANQVWCSTLNVSRAQLPFKPDVIASVYYRNIIKPHVINVVQGRIFNMHPSLLPRHRGCSSVPWAIIEGDEETGVTHHYIDQGVDTGRILSQVRTPIYARETQADLYERLMRIGAASWPQALEEVLKGAPGMVQEGESCYHKRGAPFSGQIDDAWPIDQIERFIRAMTYPPYPFATYHGREIHNLAEYLALVDDSSRWPKPSEVAANG